MSRERDAWEVGERVSTRGGARFSREAGSARVQSTAQQASSLQPTSQEAKSCRMHAIVALCVLAFPVLARMGGYAWRLLPVACRTGEPQWPVARI